MSSHPLRRRTDHLLPLHPDAIRDELDLLDHVRRMALSTYQRTLLTEIDLLSDRREQRMNELLAALSAGHD